jgi:fructokinase
MDRDMDTAERDLDVLAFGEAIVDFFPESRGLLLRDVERFERHLGGAPANVAVGLARLGARAGLMTLVGADEFGAFLLAGLAREEVDTRGVGTHRSARTGITFVAVGPRGERSFLFYRHPSADQLVAEHDVDPDLVARARVFHWGSSTLARESARAATLKALGAARAAGCVISCDPNLRMHLWSDPALASALLREALAQTHVVKISDDELGPVCGTTDVEEGARFLRGLGVELAVVTLGERGCYYDGAAAGSGWVRGLRVEVVDTTGAGDGFVAGLLASLLPALGEGAGVAALPRVVVEAACALANRVAARVVTRFGATAALPRRGEL